MEMRRISNLPYICRINPPPSGEVTRSKRSWGRDGGGAAISMAIILISTPARAQSHDHMDMEMSGMAHDQNQNQHKSSFSEGSGTSQLPANDGPMAGIHIMAGDWMLMAHGSVSAQYSQFTGPRGDAKAYATSMAMLMAQRDTSWGRIQLKSMLSLEPLMQANGYPNLFASGETAGGVPLVDRQHPHDVFMELSARVDVNLSPKTRLFLYGAPVGEPALGPSAFMHRASAAYNPEPPITHHWFDSTHITYGVATVGIASSKFQLETSLFTGREPDEKRWNIEKPRFDSWSVRGTWNPSAKWAFQASYGQLKQPEFSTHPNVDQRRFTTSLHFSNGRGLTAMVAFSAKTAVPGESLTAWLSEINWDMDGHNTLFARVENVANDELFANPAHPLHDEIFRISKFQIGFARRIPLGPVQMALGGAISAYTKPAALNPFYGNNPMGYTLFSKFTLGQ